MKSEHSHLLQKKNFLYILSPQTWDNKKQQIVTKKTSLYYVPEKMFIRLYNNIEMGCTIKTLKTMSYLR